MLDWTKQTNDPNNREARERVRQALLARRHIYTDRDLVDYVLERVAGKRVLDIGIVSHTLDYVAEEGWRHGRIVKRAAYCLGLDILREEIAKLKADGYNVRVADATSDEDLGERFDVVFIGDVIEHVDNPCRLLKFAARHLSPGRGHSGDDAQSFLAQVLPAVQARRYHGQQPGPRGLDYAVDGA